MAKLLTDSASVAAFERCVRCSFVSLGSRVPSTLVAAAYTEAHALLAPRLSGAATKNEDSYGGSSDAKAQVSWTLAELQLAEGGGEIPPALLMIARLLEHTARAYLTHVVNRYVPSAAAVLDNLEKRSVVRAWLYSGASAGCRSHCDPGLCTAMLSGTAPGLQGFAPARRDDEVPLNDPRESADTTEATPAMIAGTWEPVACSAQRRDSSTEDPSAASAEPILLFNDTTLQVLTGGAARHWLHRVVPLGAAPAGEESAPSRVNIVLELRPAQGPRWYTFRPTSEEAASLAHALHDEPGAA